MIEFNKINANNISYLFQANNSSPVTNPVGIFASNVNKCANSSANLSAVFSQKMRDFVDFEVIPPAKLKLRELEQSSIRKSFRDKLGTQYSKRQKETSDLLEHLLYEALSGDYDSYKMSYDIIFENISATIDNVDNFSEEDYKKFVNSFKTDFKNISSRDYLDQIEFKNHLNKLEQKTKDFYSASLVASGEHNAEVEDCFKAMGGNLDDVKSRYNDILNNDGVLSDLVHLAFKKEINQSFENAEADIAVLKKLKDNPVEFCRQFRLRTGVDFDIASIEHMKKEKEAFNAAQIGEQAKNAKDILKNDLPRQISHQGETFKIPNSNYNLDSFENILRSKTPTYSNLEKALFKFYGNEDASLRWIKTRTEKLGLGSLSAKERYEKLSKQFSDEMSVIEKEGLKGKSIDYYQRQYKNSVKEALGRNIPEEKINSYLNTKKIAAIGAQIGVAAITGGSSLAGTAIAMGGTSLVGRTVDQITSKNGITASQSLEFLGDAVMETVLTYGVGKVLEVGLSKLLPKTTPIKKPPIKTPSAGEPICSEFDKIMVKDLKLQAEFEKLATMTDKVASRKLKEEISKKIFDYYKAHGKDISCFSGWGKNGLQLPQHYQLKNLGGDSTRLRALSERVGRTETGLDFNIDTMEQFSKSTKDLLSYIGSKSTQKLENTEILKALTGGRQLKLGDNGLLISEGNNLRNFTAVKKIIDSQGREITYSWISTPKGSNAPVTGFPGRKSPGIVIVHSADGISTIMPKDFGDFLVTGPGI